MFPTAAIPYGYVSPPALAVISQGVSSETTMGSIPSRIVYSTIALPELHNQRQGQNTLLASRAGRPQAVAAPMQSTQWQLAQLSRPGESPNYSVAFFAQLLGQSSPQAQSDITYQFVGAVPYRPGDPEAMEVFANVKYMPSNAFKPIESKSAMAVLAQQKATLASTVIITGQEAEKQANFAASKPFASSPAAIAQGGFILPAATLAAALPSPLTATARPIRLQQIKSGAEAYQRANSRLSPKTAGEAELNTQS